AVLERGPALRGSIGGEPAHGAFLAAACDRTATTARTLLARSLAVFALAAGMVRRVQVAKVPRRDVSVDLGGGDVGMPEHRLQAAQIGAVLEQVRSERVPQRVGVDLVTVDARVQRVALHPQPEGLAGHPLPAPPDEELGRALCG